MVGVYKEIEIIPEQMFDRAIEKQDIIMVFKRNGKFIICDKEYGIKFDGSSYKVMRVIGGGKRYGNGNCNQKR